MISREELDLLTDLIYEAALVPELWPAVLGRLSNVVDGAGGLLFTSNPGRVRWAASPDIFPTMEEFIRERWTEVNRGLQGMGESH